MGGLLYSYSAGTLVPLATYVDQAGVTTNANPVVLDSTGSANVWFGSSAYKLVLKTSTGSTLWTVDNYQPDAGSIQLRSDLASTASTALGDALMGVRRTLASAVATTQHNVNEYRVIDAVVDYGADNTGATDAGPAINLAIVAADGRPIHVPAGTYKLSTGLVYSTAGLGWAQGLKLIGDGKYKTIFDNRTAGPAITLTSGGGAGDYQENAILENFSIHNTTGSLTTTGVKCIGVRNSRFTSLEIDAQKSSGIWLYSSVGDTTDNVHIDIDQCVISHCTNGSGGTGINVDGTGGGVNAAVHVRQTRILANDYGIYFTSVQNGCVEECAIAGNLKGGMIVTQGTAYSKNCIITNSEFDSNVPTQLKLDYCEGVIVQGIYWVVNTGNLVTKNVDITANALKIDIQNNMPRVVLNSNVTQYASAGTSANCRIIGTDWSAWDIGSTAGLAANVKYSGTNIYDDGVAIPWTPVFTSATGSFTTMTMNVTGAICTKIGNMVTATCYIYTNSVTVGSASGVLSISGLPFTSAPTNYAVGLVCNTFGWATNFPLAGQVGASSNKIALMYRYAINAADSYMSVTDLTTGAVASKNGLILTISFMV